MRGLKAQTASRVAWAAFAVTASLLLWSLGYVAAGGRGSVGFSILMFPFAIVGVLIASRRPGNPIGWIMLWIGFFSSTQIAERALIGSATSLPQQILLALIAGSWVGMIAPIGTFLILLFPDGRLPSPGWRPWAWLCALAMVGPYALITLAPVTFADQGFPGVRNPLGVEALRPVMDFVFVFILLIPISFLGCVVSLVRRLRRSRGQERLQLKWLAAAGSLVGIVFLVTFLASLPFDLSGRPLPVAVDLLQMYSINVVVLIPVAIGIAILKHRLYDIDVIINRALVYGALTALLTLAYFAVVTVLQGLFRPLTGRSTLAVATSTLAVAALFRPARARLQSFIDRRFYRRKYDAAQTVDRFSARLRNEIDLDSLTAELVSVVGDTVQPAHVSLWLRGPRRQAAE
jgi:hypothetical protein